MDATFELQENIALQKQLILAAYRKKIMIQFLPLIGLILLTFFFAIVTKGRLLNSSNLYNLLNQSFTVMIVAVGAVFVYSQGGIDLSLGAVLGITQIGAAYVILSGTIPSWIAIPAAILIGMICGLLTGGVHVFMGVPSFVASLCMKYICVGITSTVTSKADIYIPYTDFAIFNTGVVKAVVLVTVVIAGFIVFEFTRLGRNLKAIGGNMVAARQSGVITKTNIVLAFVIVGGLVGLAGFFTLTRVGMINALGGQGLELNILIAVVLGGLPLTGGSVSRLSSAIVGALTVTVLTNGLTLWGVDPYVIGGINGILFIIIVGITYDRSKGKLVL